MIQSLYTGLSGLKANQIALDTTANNISNASNEDYSKQIVNFSTNPQIERAGVLIGTGTHIQSIERSHDESLFSKIKNTLNYSGKESELAKNFEEISKKITEYETSGNGISSLVDNVFNSFEKLTTDPLNESLQNQLKSDLTSVFERQDSINQIMNSEKIRISTEIDLLDQKSKTLLQEFDRLSKEIAALEALNDSSSTKQFANELRDKRDSIEKELSKIGDFKVQKQQKMNQENINVTDDKMFSRSFSDNSGQIKGKREFIKELSNIQDLFNNNLNELFKNINDTYQQNGNAPLFEKNKVTEEPINISKNGAPGNVDIGLDILKIRENKFQDNLILLSQKKDFYKSQLDSTENILKTLQNIYDKKTKVNIDEEMTNLIKYQRAYQANAKVIQTADEILQTTLDLKR